MNKSKIEWCDMTWNPVTGCLHGCEYCYARRMVSRFSIQTAIPNGEIHMQILPPKTIYPYGFDPTFHCYRLDDPRRIKKPKNIFVCSMADLFGDWVPDDWLITIFNACTEAPQHVYMFLTKNPERYGQLAESGILPSGDNYWYGTTTTTADMPFWFSDRHNTFVSIEPILGPFEDATDAISYIDWVIVGAMTGPGATKHRPPREWIESISTSCSAAGVPLFMKNSLSGVREKPLIQEHPHPMMAHLGRREKLP